VSLVGVNAALVAGDHETALREAIEAWSLCKHERIVAVIEELSRRVAKGREVPGGKTLADKQAAWLALEAKHDPADLEHLLATLATVKKWPELDARLVALAARPPDPRIATALHALVEDPPLKAIIPPALELVKQIGDPRSVAVIEGLRRSKLPIAIRRLLLPTLTALQETSRAAAPTEPDLAAVERALTAGTGPDRDVPALFAAVYADPDDDGARSVLADALQELGDPRGEFITLQLMRGRTGKPTRRETSLLKQHERTWLGPIASVLDRASVVFERGFLAKCRVHYGDAGMCTSKQWATVEALELAGFEHVQRLVEAMPALRVVTGARGRLVPSHPRLEEVSLDHLLESEVAHLCSRELPSLRSLEIKECHNLRQMAAFVGSPFVARLPSLSVTVADPEAWISLFATRRSGRATVHDPSVPWTLIFDGDQLACRYHNFGPRELTQIGDALARYLARVPTPAQWHLTIASRFRGLAVLESALQRFASVAEAE
jgi:uncharacterized protein (TIGR02996 family)